MYKFNKILVGLDQSSMDVELIDAACKICQLSGSEEVIFMNLIRDFQMPDELLKQFPDILNKAIQEREEQIKKVVSTTFTCPNVKTDFIVRQGQPTKEIMKFSADEKVDLIIMGRKQDKDTSGVIPTRIARRAACSLLILPEGHHVNFKKILVPSDFSDYSKSALEKSIELAQRSEHNPEVVIQNVYQVPSGYHYTGKTYDEFAVVMKEHAMKDYKRFTGDVDFGSIDPEIIYTLDKEEDIIGCIYKQAKSTASDLIVIGAKGRSSATALFIGSKAEKLIQIDTDIPLLVVRPKGKRAGILEYIQEL